MAIEIDKMNTLSDTLAYEVDDYDNICSIGSAQRNGGVSSVGSAPVAMKFSSIFADDKTLAVFTRLLDHARASSDAVSFPYRCDSENTCNFYRLTVSISAARHVLFFNKLLGSDLRSMEIRWQHSFVDDSTALDTCSICNKIQFNSQWHYFQQLVEQKHWPASGKHMYCRSTVCFDCDRGISQRINQSLRSAS